MSTHTTNQYEQLTSSAPKGTSKLDPRLEKQRTEQHTAKRDKIRKLVRGCDRTSVIDVSYQRLNDSDIQAVIDYAFEDPQCIGLNLSGNEFTSEIISRLFGALEKRKEFKQLDLSQNRLGNKGAGRICEFLSSDRFEIEDLDLSGNNIRDEGANSLAKMLKRNQTLRDLGLNRNYITDIGLELLANALLQHQPLLERLKLDNNPFITRIGVYRTLALLQNQKTSSTVIERGKLPLKPEISLKRCNIYIGNYQDLRMRASNTDYHFVIE